MRTGGMEAYWDRRAKENPFRYVDNRRWRWDHLDEFWRTGEDIVSRLFADLSIELTGNEDVVEIGCGVGRLTRVLAREARSVSAFDVSEEMLGHAHELNPQLTNVRWLHGDGVTLAPLPDACADACLSFVVFQHLPEPELTYGYVREMGRVLRVGGWAAFQVSNDPTVHRRGSKRRTLRQVLGRDPYDHPAWRGSAVDLVRLREVATDSGLEIQRVKNEGTQFCHVLARRRAQ